MTHDTTDHPMDQAAPKSRRTSNGLSIAGLVCGLVGLLLFPIILGPLAIIFGGIGLSNAQHGGPHKGMAIAAVVLGIVDIAIVVLLLVGNIG